MKKLFYITFLFTGLIFALQTVSALPNPWVECKDDIYCGAKKAGFNFPLRVENYSVRAMKDMIEITFPLDKSRTVTIRKSELFKGKADENGIIDISGDYNNYPVDKTIWIEKAVPFRVRGNKNKFYVASFGAESGYFSFYCKKGMKIKHIKSLYKLTAEAEVHNFDETNYTLEQLMDLRRTDGIVEPVYTQDCFPKTLQKRGVTKDCFERANLGQDSFCSVSEIKMIKEYYKKGQSSDPLNNGQGQFCAD